MQQEQQDILEEHLKDKGVVRYWEDGATNEAIEQGRTNGCHRDKAIDEAIDTHPHTQAVLHRDEANNGTEQDWTTVLHSSSTPSRATCSRTAPLTAPGTTSSSGTRTAPRSPASPPLGSRSSRTSSRST